MGQLVPLQFGLKSVAKLEPVVEVVEPDEFKVGLYKFGRDGQPVHDKPPDTIWVRGTKAQNYRVNVIQGSSLKQLQAGLYKLRIQLTHSLKAPSLKP
jgi:hypothetical protein